jgi:hypothetical protein
MSQIANYKQSLNAFKIERHKQALAALDTLPADEKNRLLAKASRLKSHPATVKDTKHLWKKCKGGYQSVTREVFGGVTVHAYTPNALPLAEGWQTAHFSVGDQVAIVSHKFDVWHTHRMGSLGVGFSNISHIQNNGTIVLANGMQFDRRCREANSKNALWLYEDVINCPILKKGQRRIRYTENFPFPGMNCEWYLARDQDDDPDAEVSAQDAGVIDVFQDPVTGEWDNPYTPLQISLGCKGYSPPK